MVRKKYKNKRVNGKLMAVHRLVMEQCLGRKLRCDEHVHHIDGDTLNNNIENLQLMSSSEHTTLEWTGRKHSEGAKRKMSESKKALYSRVEHPWVGRMHTDETKRRLSEINTGSNNPFYGRKHTNETKRKQSESNMGHKVSEVTRQKISDSLSLRRHLKEY